MAEKPLIYAVDDEEGIRELYRCALEGAGFSVTCFADGEALFVALRTRLPRLILLDIMLDGMDGYAILEKLRKGSDTRDIPVMMVSAKGEEISKVKGLNLGADDYLAKPFGVLELVARIQAHLRRFAVPAPSYKDIRIDEETHTAYAGDRPLTLTLKEYELLKALVLRAPAVLRREELLGAVWGSDYIGETRTLDMHIATLRKNLGAAQAEIHTIRGVGYALQ